MAPRARNKFCAHIFEPDVFRKQLYCIEDSTCDIAETFLCPRSDSAPGELFPLAPLVTPSCTTVTGNEQISLFFTVKQYSFPCKNIKSKLPDWLLATWKLSNMAVQFFKFMHFVERRLSCSAAARWLHFASAKPFFIISSFLDKAASARFFAILEHEVYRAPLVFPYQLWHK